MHCSMLFREQQHSQEVWVCLQYCPGTVLARTNAVPLLTVAVQIHGTSFYRGMAAEAAEPVRGSNVLLLVQLLLISRRNEPSCQQTIW